MFKGFKPQGLQKIATRMGYAGSMENFDEYLKQNPDKEREMIVYRARAQEMARGGAVRKKMQEGGIIGKFPMGNTIPGIFGAPVGSLGTPTQEQPQPKNANTLPDYDAFKQYQSTIPNNMFRASLGVIVPRRLADGTVVNFGSPLQAEDYDNYLKSIGKPPTSDPRNEDIGGSMPITNKMGTGAKELSSPVFRNPQQEDPRDTPAVQPQQAQQAQQQPVTQSMTDPRQQAYVPTLGTAEGQVPAYGTTSDPKGIGDVTSTLAQTGAIPVGAVTQPELINQQQGQFINPATGQLTSTPVAPTYGADTSQAAAPTQVTSTQMQAAQATPAVQTAIQTNQAAQADVSDPRAQVLAAQQTASSVSNLEAAQGTATLMDNPVQRKIQSGELIDGVADAQTAASFTEQVQAATATPSEKATVQGQLASLTANFDMSNPPPWAAGALRGIQAQLQQRGLGASSIAGQALIQGALESALPIAQADAQVTAQFEAQNLSNRQQRAMLAAQQRATFLGQEFDQAFQSRVQNASKIADIANTNFNAEQQIALENSRAANTMNLNNLSNKQALVMAEASALANLDLSNLSNRQQSAVQNAQNFLQMDMANLSNQQQANMFNAQQRVQSLFTDQAAENAARQFNATSQNQVDQFFASLGQQASQFNATQINAQEQFNAGQRNTVERFNAELNNQRDQFNAQNQMVIAQSNANWRRQIATQATAATNRANELNAQNVLGLSNQAYNNLWQYYGDTMEWAWTSAENERSRVIELAKAQLAADSNADIAKMKGDYNSSAAFGGLIGKFITGGLLGGGGFGGLF